VPGAHTIILYAKRCYVQNGGKRTGKKFLHAGIHQDNVSVNDIFGHVMERIRQPGSLSTTGTRVERAGLSI
jgi:hypothetical protein